MKIRLSQLRTIIREELQRLQEAGDYGEDGWERKGDWTSTSEMPEAGGEWQQWFNEKPGRFRNTPDQEGGGTVQGFWPHHMIIKMFGQGATADDVRTLMSDPGGSYRGPGQSFMEPATVEERVGGWSIEQRYGLDV